MIAREAGRDWGRLGWNTVVYVKAEELMELNWRAKDQEQGDVMFHERGEGQGLLGAEEPSQHMTWRPAGRM